MNNEFRVAVVELSDKKWINLKALKWDEVDCHP